MANLLLVEKTEGKLIEKNPSQLTIVSRVLDENVLHDRRHAPCLHGRGRVGPAFEAASTSPEDLHMSGIRTIQLIICLSKQKESSQPKLTLTKCS